MQYTGAQVEPHFMLNLSRQFARLIKENYQAARRFLEQPIAGFPLFADQLTDEMMASKVNHRDELIMNKYKNEQKPKESKLSTQATEFKPKKVEEAKKYEPKKAKPSPVAEVQGPASELKPQEPAMVIKPSPAKEGGMFGGALPSFKVKDPALV